jgi:hypothetical protein
VEIVNMAEYKTREDMVQDLIYTTKFLLYLGSPAKPSAEFSRTVKKALEEVNIALWNLETGDNIPFPMTKEDKITAKRLAEKVSLRPNWLLDANV